MTATQTPQPKPKTVALTPLQILLAVLATLLIGAGAGNAVGNNNPTTPTTTTTTSTSTSTTTSAPPGTTTTIVVTPIPNADVKPYYNPNASWNQPVSKIGKAPAALQDYAKRLYNYGGGTAPPGGFNTAFGDYSVPWYPREDANTTVRIFQATWAQALYTTPYLKNGSEIPWNDKWKPGTGNDNLMAIIDRKTGEIWELGGIGQLKVNCFDFFGINGQAGYDVNNPKHLCTTGGSYSKDLYTASDVDKTTKDGRGMGIDKQALIPRAEEVKSGAIKHALEITITNTMFGSPACSPIQGPNVKGFGTKCGGFVKPATKLERTNPDVGCANKQVVTVAERSKTIPEGMRFAVNATNAEIAKWLDSRGYTGAKRETARIFAIALRDYGFIVGETGCYGMHFETDSSIAGAAAPVWAELGVPADGKAYPHGDLMQGFITIDNLYVVNTADEYVLAR